MYFASYDDKEIARLQLPFDYIYFLEWFINWKNTGKMISLPNEECYWIDYKTVIEKLPALQIHNTVSISHMLDRLCGKGKVNYADYPLIRKIKNIRGRNRAYFSIRGEVVAKMKGIEYSYGLFDKKDIPAIPEKKDIALCSLAPNVEKILIELNRLQLPNKKLFSFTLPTDHKIHTKSMRRFQQACFNLYDGKFLEIYKLSDYFKQRNNYYIDSSTIKEINDCKGNWNQIFMVMQCAAKNYISWFEPNRESLDKGWLTRDIGDWAYYDEKSMFIVSIKCKASKTREVIAETTYNRLPVFIQNKFLDFYKDEWDGLSYWNKIYSVYKWYKDNAKDLMADNINYSYWLDKGINDFMQGYYDFINGLGQKYLKHFGTKCNTWNWFINDKKEEHGIEE